MCSRARADEILEAKAEVVVLSFQHVRHVNLQLLPVRVHAVRQPSSWKKPIRQNEMSVSKKMPKYLKISMKCLICFDQNITGTLQHPVVHKRRVYESGNRSTPPDSSAGCVFLSDWQPCLFYIKVHFLNILFVSLEAHFNQVKEHNETWLEGSIQGNRVHAQAVRCSRAGVGLFYSPGVSRLRLTHFRSRAIIKIT